MTDTTRKNLGIVFLTLLIIWGGYTTLIYFGVPVHGSALLSNELYQNISPSECAAGADLCYLQRGIQALIPTIFFTLSRALPLLGYALISLLAYGGYVFLKGSSDGKILMKWSPWKIAALGIASVWLFSTTLSMGSVNGQPVRMYVEPTKDAYPSISAQALQTLQSEFQELRGKGCLSETDKQFESGAKVYMFSNFCVQGAFFTRVVPQILFVAILLFEMLILGRALLVLIRFRFHDPAQEMLISAGLGAGGIIAILWSAAVLGVFTVTAGWAIALAIPMLGYKQTLYWGNRFLFAEWEDERNWYDIRILIVWLLISYLALNFLQVIRPFPIGWDDLGSYLNRPRLLVSYGTFIPTMSPFEWGYLTSLGFLLFGYNSAFGSTAAMMVNWTAGLLAICGVWGFARLFLGKREGALSALLYYSLPLVGHFSFADMKIDNAVFFFGTLSTLCVFASLFHKEHLSQRTQNIFLILGGIFVGLAFSTKPTAVMVIFPLIATVAGTLNWYAFYGMTAFIFAYLSHRHVLSVSDILQRSFGTDVPASDMIFQAICAMVGTGILALALLKNRTQAKAATVSVALFAIGICVSVFPWIAHNNYVRGNLVPRLELSVDNTLSPKLGVDSLPPELAVNKESPECKPTGAKEELDRYWGYDHGWSHYLTLPWRTVMNIDSAGYYVTTIPALLLFPLLLLLPWFWTERGRWARWLWIGTFFILIEWMLLANGIPWYGIGVFLGLVVALEILVKEAPTRGGRMSAAVIIALSLVTAFGHRFWQLEQQRNIFEYSMGKISAESLREITIPYYDDIATQTIERHEQIPDRPYLYRIGTFIAYFIPKNLEVIGITDHQLDVFNCMYQERDAALTTKRLKALGFNSLVFDTNTATIEMDPNGSLHQKVNAFVEYVNSPASNLQVILSDTSAGIGYILIP